MTLHKILRQVMRQIGDIGCDHVTIARAGEHAYQIRFSPDRDFKTGYRVEGRRWVTKDDPLILPEALKEDPGWARWSRFLGFSTEGVLAEDWDFVDDRRRS